MRPGKRERAALRAQVQFVKDARLAFEKDKAVKLTFNSIHAASIHEVDRLVRGASPWRGRGEGEVKSSANRDTLKVATTHGYQDNLHQPKAFTVLKRVSVKG